MGAITWTDGIGSASFGNGKPGAGARFSAWSTRPVDPGPADHELGSGQRHKFAFGVRYCVTFTIDQFPASSRATLDRLAAWLDAGGTVAVDPGDGVNGPYNCCQMQGADLPVAQLVDRGLAEYSAQFALMRNDNVAAPLLCAY